MMARSTPASWGSVAKALHWGMFLLFAVVMLVGYYMTDLPLGMAKLKIYALHKSIGVLLLLLVSMRVVWRMLDRRPERDAMPVWQRQVSILVVVLLYGLMFGMPLSGWLYNSAAGFPLRWFNLVNLPALMPPNPVLKTTIKEWHETGATIFLGIVGVHVLGSFKHHFVDRDRTLIRMLPWRK
jgi:cytochrome b561